MPPGASLFAGHWPFPGLALLGLGVGLAAGMFGVGGGFLMVPLLNLVFGIPLGIAVGSGLCQMIGTALAAFRRHHRLHQGEVKLDWIMMGGSLVGVQAGAMTIEVLSGAGAVHILGYSIPAVQFWVSTGYVLVLTAAGAGMLHDARHRPSGMPLDPGILTRIRIPPYTYLPQCEHRISILVVAYLGLLLGFLSGMMGIGGGVALMPILLYGVGMRIRVAAGTGLLVLLSTSISGTLAHAGMGHVNLGIAMALLAGSTLGAPIGATLTSRMDGRRLRAIFAYLVFATALAVLWNLVRTLH